MVQLDITPVESKLVVRFKRQFSSRMLPDPYMATELIVTVPVIHRDDIEADCNAYARLPAQSQAEFISRLRTLPRYTERLLEDHPEPAPVDNTAQPPLF